MSCILVNNLSSIAQAKTHRPFDPSVGGVQGGKQTIGALPPHSNRQVLKKQFPRGTLQRQQWGGVTLPGCCVAACEKSVPRVEGIRVLL